MFTNQGSEAVGKYQVSQVLLDEKNLVLVINYFPRHSREIFKGKFVGINCKNGSKRRTAEINKFITATAKTHCKKIHFQWNALRSLHPAFTKIALGILTIRCFRLLLIRTVTLSRAFGLVMVQTYTIDKVGYSFISKNI